MNGLMIWKTTVSDLIPITRAALLERLAEIDALLDILAENDELTLYAEREDILRILGE